MAVTWLYFPLTLSRLGLRNLGMGAWGHTLKVYKVFTKVCRGPWLRGDSGPADVINCSPLSASFFWVSLFPRTYGFNNTIQWFLLLIIILKASVQFSRSVMCNFLPFHGLQHARPPCPSPTPTVYSNSCPLSQWGHPTISSSVVPFSCLFSSIRVFLSESSLCIRWPKYWSFSFNISPSNEHPGLISFRMDWWDLLAVQGTLESLLHHQSSKASILRHSAFFIVQLSHPYMITGKTIALTKQTFVDKVTPLLFNMLPRLVITFLSRSKHP